MSFSSRLFSVTNRTILITGGGRGIGSMLAQGYYEAGANVIITSRTEDSLKETMDTILKNSPSQSMEVTPSLSYVVSDVSTREGCEKLASEIGPLLPDGRLDVLINNAGNAWGEPLERESGKMNWGWDKVLDLNLKGVFYLSRACLPQIHPI
jgi:NAD(P)-dependent dehydrogenase (short-subunit alcohol dehydrogenase family)